VAILSLMVALQVAGSSMTERPSQTRPWISRSRPCPVPRQPFKPGSHHTGVDLTRPVLRST
jgi:hypothetical protein